MSFKSGDIENAQKQLSQLDKVIQASLPRAARAGAGVLKEEAIRRTPVRTGKLSRSFENREGTASEKTALNSAVHVVYNKAFYAAAVERGRYKRPFMRPAIDATTGKMTDAMETSIKRSADKVL